MEIPAKSHSVTARFKVRGLLNEPQMVEGVYRKVRWTRRRSQGGFTLLELMVVIIIIGLMSVIALPTMIEARREQHTYDDASQILELMRNGRARAIGRGTATLITLDTTNGSRGIFRMSEGTGASPEIPGQLKAPRPSCFSANPASWVKNDPAGGFVDWTLPNQFIEGVDLNGNAEAELDSNIWAKITTYGLAVPGGGGPPCGGTCTPQRVDVCFTSAGRPFVSVDTDPPLFSPSSPFVGVVEVAVGRLLAGQSNVIPANAHGPIRHVFLPPSGIARLSSSLP